MSTANVAHRGDGRNKGEEIDVIVRVKPGSLGIFEAKAVYKNNGVGDNARFLSGDVKLGATSGAPTVYGALTNLLHDSMLGLYL